MKTYSFPQVSEPALLRDCETVHARERGVTAQALAYLAEVDARKAYVPAGYDSMFAYCVGALRLSEQAARKRIHAARAARRFPAIFPAVAEGRLHLSGVVLLAPHLTETTADDLLAAAAGQGKAEIERLLAERFPRPEVMAWVETLPAPSVSPMAEQQAPGPVGEQRAPGRVESPAPRAQVAPLAAGRFALQFSVGQGTLDDLAYAQALASHQIPSGDIAEVFGRALKAYIRELEKTKFAATARPRAGQPRQSASARHIPAAVKRAVWERDGGQCTYTSETGHRCEARKFLEFDHSEAFARGGEATVAGIRIRCRAHNQYEAERVFGAGFMDEKRQAAQRAAADRRAAALTEAEEKARVEAEAKAQATAAQARAKANEVIPWLRGLGFRAEEARAAAALCENIPDAPLEQRVRLALSYSRRKRSTPGACRAGTEA